jgi:hypothetical protein
VPDLLWGDVRNFFGPGLVGALPDVSVAGASVEDWRAVFELVRSGGWAWEYSGGGVGGRLYSAADVLARAAGAGMVGLRVWPVPGVLVIFRRGSAGGIDFDVDLRELRGQGGVVVLCVFLGAVGRRLGRPVRMAAGGDRGNSVLGLDPAADRVVLLAVPLGVRLPAAAGRDS